MRHFTKILGFSTAVALILTTGVLAADNSAYLTQDGDGNSANIQQAAGPGGNDFGLEDAPALQLGNNNVINELQATGGGFDRGNNDVVALTQDGNNNNFSQTYSNRAGDNVITDVDQIGDFNRFSVTRNASIEGEIGTVLQEGNSNFLTISQSSRTGHGGTGNTVTLVNMIGSNNGWTTQPPSRWGIDIDQRGSNNTIDEASIYGSGNASSGGLPAIEIDQYGTGNGLGSVGQSTAIIYGTLSHIDIYQDGSYNDFYVTQGTEIAPGSGNSAIVTQVGIDNDVTIVQEGSNQDATVSQTGDDNHVNAKQLGGNNVLVATIDGDQNGAGTFTGDRLTLANAKGLASGDLFQDGLTNDIDLNISSSLNNFAVLQKGNGNLADIDISGGDGNEALISQVGNDNVGVIAQVGGSNVAIVSQ